MNTIKEVIKYIDGTDFLSECVDTPYLEGKELDEIEDIINMYIHEHEVIYYSVAMDFLAENDPSLAQSMELASEYGVELTNISSELLATMLFQQYAQEELSELLNELEV